MRLHHSLNQPYLSRMFLLCLPRMCLYVAACTVLYRFTCIHQALACTHTHPGCNRDTCSSKIPISEASTAMSSAKLYLGNTESGRVDRLLARWRWSFFVKPPSSTADFSQNPRNRSTQKWPRHCVPSSHACLTNSHNMANSGYLVFQLCWNKSNTVVTFWFFHIALSKELLKPAVSQPKVEHKAYQQRASWLQHWTCNHLQPTMKTTTLHMRGTPSCSLQR